LKNGVEIRGNRFTWNDGDSVKTGLMLVADRVTKMETLLGTPGVEPIPIKLARIEERLKGIESALRELKDREQKKGL
jgi:hypothetical protein